MSPLSPNDDSQRPLVDRRQKVPRTACSQWCTDTWVPANEGSIVTSATADWCDRGCSDRYGQVRCGYSIFEEVEPKLYKVIRWADVCSEATLKEKCRNAIYAQLRLQISYNDQRRERKPGSLNNHPKQYWRVLVWILLKFWTIIILAIWSQRNLPVQFMFMDLWLHQGMVVWSIVNLKL